MFSYSEIRSIVKKTVYFYAACNGFFCLMFALLGAILMNPQELWTLSRFIWGMGWMNLVITIFIGGLYLIAGLVLFSYAFVVGKGHPTKYWSKERELSETEQRESKWFEEFKESINFNEHWQAYRSIKELEYKKEEIEKEMKKIERSKKQDNGIFYYGLDS